MDKTVAQARKEKRFGEAIMIELALNKGETNENKVTVGASVTPIERAQLNDLADIIGMKSSALMRAAVRRTLREAREAGLIPQTEAA